LITKEVKIAHLSDLHISGKQDRRQLDDLDHMFDHFNSEGFNHIIISGDLSNAANPDDWEIVKEKLVKHGQYNWEKTTVIAGNHDLTNLEEELRFYNALNPLSFFRKNTFTHKLSEFARFFHELITGKEIGDVTCPFVKIINYPSLSIAITALNSVYPWSPYDNPLGARGIITSRQLYALSQNNVFSSLRGCFVIGLCHHAYKVYGTDSLIDQAFDWTMELKNRTEFLDCMIALHAKLVLHGHFHRFQSYMVKGVLFINGGSFRYSPKQYSELVIEGQESFRQRFVTFS